MDDNKIIKSPTVEQVREHYVRFHTLKHRISKLKYLMNETVQLIDKEIMLRDEYGIFIQQPDYWEQRKRHEEMELNKEVKFINHFTL